MDGVLDALRGLNLLSILVRLFLAMVLGGIVGLERGRKHRAAGFRTYMLVCMGAALTMLLGQYQDLMLTTRWAEQAAALGGRSDIARYGAQVISGIGFLGAGTIVLTGRKEVKGLTTAAGLWACACMGLAIGAGFYECVLLSFAIIIMVILLLPKIESFLIEKSRNMDIYVEVFGTEGIHQVIDCLKRQNIHIYGVDINHSPSQPEGYPSAIFSIGLCKKQTHTGIIKQLSRLDAIHSIQEL